MNFVGRKLQKWQWAVLALVVLVGGPLVYVGLNKMREEREFQAALDAARKEGLVITAAEFTATIPTAKPEENAAEFYRAIAWRFHKDDLAKPVRALLDAPTASAQAEAEALLSKHAEALQLIEQALSRPKCWFDRDWSLGPATSMPELAMMKSSGQLLRVRRALALSRGQHSDAIADAERVVKIASHVQQETPGLATLTAVAIHTSSLELLAHGAHRHRDVPGYRQALAKHIEAMPKRNLKQELRGILFYALTVIELCNTQSGLDKLELTDEDFPKGLELMKLLIPPHRGRMMFVQAARDYYAALDLPEDQQTIKIDEALSEFWQGMLAFPKAAHVLEMFSEGPLDSEMIQRSEHNLNARHTLYRALARALEPREPPTSIKTDDLLSPRGTPVKYRLQKGQMIVEVEGPAAGDDPLVLKVPRAP